METATENGNPETEARGADRVVVFSDAVLAIAITLLALELPVPAGTSGTTNGQLLDALGKNLPDYLAFLISFAVIGNHWATHRRVFRYVGRLDGRVGQLNLLWLLMVTLIPFAQRMLEGDGGWAVRFGTFAVIQVIASTCMAQMNREIIRKDLLRPDAPEPARRLDNTRGYSIIIAFLVSIPLAFVIGRWAYILWAAGPLMPRMLRRLPLRRRPSGDPGGA
jgi:uncharacterized membrane protein